MLARLFTEIYSVIISLEGDDWTAITAVIILISVLILAVQLREIQRATYAQSFFTASGRLQDEDLREERRRIYSLIDTPYEKWTKEDKLKGERVCFNFDIVGLLIRKRMLPADMVVDNWNVSIRTFWPIIEPMVKEYRKEREAPEFWHDFEYLYYKAVDFEKKRAKKRKDS